MDMPLLIEKRQRFLFPWLQPGKESLRIETRRMFLSIAPVKDFTMHRFWFALTLPVLLIFGGCGDRTSPPVAPTDNSPSTVSPSSTSAMQSDSIPEVSELPQQENATELSASKEKVSDGTSIENGTSATKKLDAINADPPKMKQAATHPTPTPEQIAKWAIVDHEPLQLLACYDGFGDGLIDAMAISPNAKQFVLGGTKLTLWNTTESKPIVDLISMLKQDEVERPIRSAAISPDGNLLAAGDQKGMLRIWNMDDQREVVAVRAHDAHLTRMAFSPNSQVLATTSYSGEVRLWQTTDGKKIKSLKMGEQEIASLVFLSDKLLASAGGEANIWNIESEKKETVLSTGYVMGPALGLSNDRRLLAFSDKDSLIPFYDIEKQSTLTNSALHGGAIKTVSFSRDGKWIATNSSDSTIRIWDGASLKLVQIMDADGGRTTDVQWLPGSNVLMVASELGRVRIWGTPDDGKSMGLDLIQMPQPGSIAADSQKSLSSARLKQIMDIRTFPRLPSAKSQWGNFNTSTYSAPASQREAEMFYRYTLGKAEWLEVEPSEQRQQGLVFSKEGCLFNVSFYQATVSEAGSESDLQVHLGFAGNYDIRWLPQYSVSDSKSSYSLAVSDSYRTKADLTEVEVALLKQFHAAGWTAYTRLNSSSAENPDSRTFYMLHGGSELVVSIGYPSDSTEELYVQTSVSASNKSLPIPPDAGWIEFDSSTDLQLVATTKMDLEKTIEFFDSEMKSEGWLAREASRRIQTKEGKAWLPYIRGQQDATIRLVSLPDERTRVIVGKADGSSWQLTKPPAVNPEVEKNGIQAADFQILRGAESVKFDVDEKKIEFVSPEMTPPALVEQYAKQMELLEWKRESRGLVSEEYTFATFTKGKAEIQIRAHLKEFKGSSAGVSGDGLLWTKPLPTPPIRVSYETWLRRDRRDTTLDRLDEFADEMKKLPVATPSKK